MNLDGYALPIKKLKGTEPVESLDLSRKNLHAASAIVIASLICDNASVTKILVGGNNLGDEGATILCDALRESTVTKVQKLDLRFNGIGPEGAKAVAAIAAVVASLTQLDVGMNSLGEQGKAVLRNAVEGRSGFELKL